jgi:hypothetical protein
MFETKFGLDVDVGKLVANHSLLEQLKPGNTLPPLRTDEFTKDSKIDISYEIQWFTLFVNSSV